MKDERIFIQSFKNRPCVDCPAASNMKNCTCPDLHRFSHGINKSEAIDKMARAILIADTPDNKENDELLKLKLKDTKMLKICKIYAKAALKALLGEWDEEENA